MIRIRSASPHSAIPDTKVSGYRMREWIVCRDGMDSLWLCWVLLLSLSLLLNFSLTCVFLCVFPLRLLLGGIFLARCKLESHNGTKILHPGDIYLGATVTILSHQFDVHDCDQYTFKYMEANPSQWVYSDVTVVNQKLKARKEILQRLLITYPGLATRTMDVALWAEICEKAELDLVKQEVCTIFRAVDATRTGVIKMTKMLKYIMDL